MQSEEWLLAQCRKLIEEKLGWGESKTWTNQDFSRLSEEIAEATDVVLSPTTLKRIWGKVRYQSAPNTTTLDTLVGFLGYGNWRSFRMEYANMPAATSATPGAPETPALISHEPSTVPRTAVTRSSQGLMWSLGLLTGITIALLLAFSLRVKQVEPTPLDAANFSFRSRPTASGLPNSVVFTYHASQAPSDCVYVQQSWDPKRRFKVPKAGKHVTSLYYYPGYFQAKLLVGNQVVKEHALLIPTKGWLPLVEQEPVPVYFKPEEAINKGVLALSADVLQGRGISLQPVVPWVNYWYVQDFGDLTMHSFTLETELKNDYATGSAACQHSEVVLLCAGGAIKVPLTVPGCVSGISLHLPGKQIRGANTDLSAFGCDFSRWVKLRLEKTSRSVRILVNDQLALTTALSANGAKIVGLGFRFQGTGSVNYVRLSDSRGKQILNEQF